VVATWQIYLKKVRLDVALLELQEVWLNVRHELVSGERDCADHRRCAHHNSHGHVDLVGPGQGEGGANPLPELQAGRGNGRVRRSETAGSDSEAS
jgi:hypothetical protein